MLNLDKIVIEVWSVQISVEFRLDIKQSER